MCLFLLAILALTLAACASGPPRPDVADAALTVDPLAMEANAAATENLSYRIGEGDTLKVSVFQVPDLSFDSIVVDTAGNLQLPLIGSVHAAGLTPAEITAEVERLLSQRYLRDPQVNITVVKAVSQKVTVDGAVTRPGVYELSGRTTLLQAVAMAAGPVKEADLHSVAVFRTVGDRRMVAVFDLAAIRNGQLEDPAILGEDVVIVDTSRLNAALREAIALLPGMAVFAYL